MNLSSGEEGPYLITLSSEDETGGENDVRYIGAGCHGYSVGQRVGDGEAVGDALAYSRLELNGAHDPWGCGLEGDVVEKILSSLLIPKGHLREKRRLCVRATHTLM